MPGITSCPLQVLSCLLFIKLYEIVYIVTQLVELKKSSHSEVKYLSRSLLMSYRSQILIQAVWLQSYSCVPVCIISLYT